jgi:hypothetical protein
MRAPIQYLQNAKAVLRVIPHRNVLNSSNARLWHVMHDLLAVSDHWRQRVRRSPGDGWTYRAKDDVWWAVTMRAEAEGDDTALAVEYYLALPEGYADVFDIKLRNHPQWSSCTLQAADAFPLPEQDADLYALKAARSDMFSLDYKRSEQTSPCRSILSVMREMEAGDSATLLFRFQTVSRSRWKDQAEYEWNKWAEGRVPQRAEFDPRRLARGAGRLAMAAGVQAFGMARQVLEAIEGSFFGNKEPLKGNEAELLGLLDPERAALLVNGDLSTPTKQKRNLPVFAAALHLVVGAPTAARRTMLAHSLASAFAELAGDNYLHPVELPAADLEPLRRLDVPLYSRAPVLLSVEEVGKLCQLPTAEVQREFEDALEANRRVEVEVPTPFMDDTGIYVGDTAIRDKRLPVYIPTANHDMLMTPRAVLGSPRMGKDMHVVNMVVEAYRHHKVGAVVLDVVDERNGHRGMADALRDHLPPEAVIDLNLGDTDHAIPVNLHGIVNTGNERVAADRLAKEVCAFLLTDQEQHRTKAYLRAAAKAVGGDLLGILLVLTCDGYREERLAEMQVKGMDTTTLEEYGRMGPQMQAAVYGPILVRLGDILDDEMLQPMFCQVPKPDANLRQWLADGKVVIYRVPTGILGEDTVRLLAHWITTTVFLTKLSMGAGGSPPCWFVLNEPHQYLSEGFTHACKRMLAEGPKYRLAPVFMVHNLRQLPQDFTEVLMSASLNWHLFKNSNAYVYDRLATYLAPTFDPATAMAATPAYHYIAVWLAPNGEYQTPFMVEAPPLVWKRYETQDHTFLTIRHSRQFGRPVDDVRAEIRRRQAEAAALAPVAAPATKQSQRPARVKS